LFTTISDRAQYKRKPSVLKGELQNVHGCGGLAAAMRSTVALQLFFVFNVQRVTERSICLMMPVKHATRANFDKSVTPFVEHMPHGTLPPRTACDLAGSGCAGFVAFLMVVGVHVGDNGKLLNPQTSWRQSFFHFSCLRASSTRSETCAAREVWDSALRSRL